MSSIAGMIMAFWLGLAPPDKVNWRAVYVLTRPRIYMVRCGMRQGAGFLYRSNQTIVTSLSLAGCGREARIIRYPTDKGVKARLVAYVSKYDLALLRVKTPLLGPPIPASSDPLLSVGQRVALIGHPYNPKGTLVDRLKEPLSWSLNVGVLGRISKFYLQVQIHRVPGYIGAPVLDRRGRILGMLTKFGPGGNPIGMCVRLELIDSLFARPPPKKGWPFFAFEFHAHARFSIALGQSSGTSVSPSNQELRLHFVLYDQWDLCAFIGFDLLGIQSDLDLSALGGLAVGYRFLLPRLTRPYLNYISLEVGGLASLVRVQTKGTDVNDIKLSNQFGVTVWVGVRFFSIAGQFSVGMFFDFFNLININTNVVPVLSFSWGV